LVYGDFEITDRDKKDVFTYFRSFGGKSLFIECNLSDKAIRRNHPVKEYRLVLSNYQEASEELKPYEANLYQVTYGAIASMP
jgi:oligo-1,6-glucosidase